MRKKLIIIGILLTVLVLPIFNAHEEKVVKVVDAGVTPDSFLWGLDKALDDLNLLLTFNPAEKAKKGIEIARERLEEVKVMVEANKVEAAEKGKEAQVKILSKVKQSISDIKEENSTKQIEEEIEIEKELEEHEEEIEEVSNNLKIKIEVKGALNEEQKALIDSLLSTLKDKAGEVKIEIKNKKDKTKIEIKQETDKSEKEIEEEIEDIEEEKGLADIKKGKAAEEIKDAKEDLAELEKELQEHKSEGHIADEKPLTELMDNAKKRISNAEEAFAKKDFGEAFGQANAAQQLIKNAEKILEKTVEKFEEEEEEHEEEEREIEVKIEGIETKVKIGIGDTRLKFTTHTTDKNTIIEEIAERTGLSIDEVTKLTEFEVEKEEKIEKEDGDKIKVVSISELMSNPISFLNEIIQVTGKLMNIGQSYFNPSFVISDGKNNFRVTSWLPLEVPPPLPSSAGEQPSTMSDYLDKSVTLQGKVKRGEQGFYLDVEKGKIEEKGKNAKNS